MSVVAKRLDGLRYRLVWRYASAHATVFDGNPAAPEKKAQPHPIFVPYLLWPNAWIDRPRRRWVVWGRSSPLKGHSSPVFYHVYCGQTAGWMKTPLDTEVDLGPGHIVLDGVPAPRERGTVCSPPFRRMLIYCGHGRPSAATAELLYLFSVGQISRNLNITHPSVRR